MSYVRAERTYPSERMRAQTMKEPSLLDSFCVGCFWPLKHKLHIYPHFDLFFVSKNGRKEQGGIDIVIRPKLFRRRQRARAASGSTHLISISATGLLDLTQYVELKSLKFQSRVCKLRWPAMTLEISDAQNVAHSENAGGHGSTANAGVACF